MFGKKRKFSARKKMHEEMTLQITSMADIFTIILLFLLKGFAGGALSLSPSKDVSLPIAGEVSEHEKDALKIEVSSGGISVDGVTAVTLENYQFAPQDVKDGEVKSLTPVLKKAKDRQEYIASKRDDVQKTGEIIIMSDKKVPYGTLKPILASAANVGYSDFKLAVIKK